MARVVLAECADETYCVGVTAWIPSRDYETLFLLNGDAVYGPAFKVLKTLDAHNLSLLTGLPLPWAERFIKMCDSNPYSIDGAHITFHPFEWLKFIWLDHLVPPTVSM